MSLRTPRADGLAVAPNATATANDPAASVEELQAHRFWGRYATADDFPNAVDNAASSPAYDMMRPGDVVWSQADGLIYTLQDRGTSGGANAVWRADDPSIGGAFITGNYYNAALNATATSTIISAANRVELTPYRPTRTLTIDRLGFDVTVGVAAALGRGAIYSGTPWPDALLLVTADLSCAGAVFVEDTVSFTFLAGQRYWLALHTSAASTQRALALEEAPSLGLLSGGSGASFTKCRRTLAFGGGLPASWVFSAAELTTTAPPDLRFRAA